MGIDQCVVGSKVDSVLQTNERIYDWAKQVLLVWNNGRENDLIKCVYKGKVSLLSGIVAKVWKMSALYRHWQ